MSTQPPRFGKFILQEQLGIGLQGEVYLGFDPHTKEHVAIKFVCKEKLGTRKYRNLKREVAAMQSVGAHPNVIRVISVDWDAQIPMNLEELVSGVENGKSIDAMEVDNPNTNATDPDSKQVVALVMELATGGELFNYLMYSGSFSEKMARTYFHMLIDALKHCHANGVTHRDIKAENILLDESFSLKLADFGLSSKHESGDGQNVQMRTICGTAGYMAPEILQGGRYDGPPTDVWSAGVLLFIMIAGFPPMQQATRGDWWFDRVKNRQMTHFWNAHKRTCPDFPKGGMQLLNQIFHADPEQRITLEDIEADSWYCGEVLRLSDLKNELVNRKATVAAKIAEEKAKKKAERQKKRRKNRRRDLYGSNVCRSVNTVQRKDSSEISESSDDIISEGKNDDEIDTSSLSIVHCKESFLDRKRNVPGFCSIRCSPKSVFPLVKKALIFASSSPDQIVIVGGGTNKICCTVKTTVGGICKVVLSLYCSTNNDEKRKTDIFIVPRKVAGSLIDFQIFAQRFRIAIDFPDNSAEMFKLFVGNHGMMGLEQLTAPPPAPPSG